MIDAPSTQTVAALRIVQFGRWLSHRAVTTVILAFCLVSLALVGHRVLQLPLLEDLEYAESYITYDVQHFSHFGTIYRDLSQPPYLPAQYSPAGYIAYSLPGHLVGGDNPFIGARVLALLFFVGCLGTLISIGRLLLPGRWTAAWCAMLACSISGIWQWIPIIRMDFPGVLFGLLSVRLLMSRSRSAILVAGLCAGLALQFKITFIAAGVTGTVWLLSHRAWKGAATFMASAAITSIGLYLAYWQHEPRMLAQMLYLSPSIPDVRGGAGLIIAAISNFVALLALYGIAKLLPSVGREWGMLLLFALTSFAVASLTVVQAGANWNYFIEPLMAIVPFAVLGMYQLSSLVQRNSRAGAFIAATLFVYVLVPRVRELAHVVASSESVTQRNERFRKFSGVLSGHPVFSTITRVALLDSVPPLIEPYLLTYASRMHKIDPEIIESRVRNGEFAVVVTSIYKQEWRGISFIQPSLRSAIVAGYRPECLFNGWLVQVRSHPMPTDSALVGNLASIGCTPVETTAAVAW